MSEARSTVRTVTIGLLVLTALPVLGQAPEVRRLHTVRHVLVTDDHCGVDGARKPDHRRCALECLSKGATMMLYVPELQALYSIESWKSGEVELKALNDFTGLDAMVSGSWDDVNHVVVVDDLHPYRSEAEAVQQPESRGRGRP